MLGKPFRFLQASDFHLQQPPFGLAEIPDYLTELLAESPYRAAARVFDLALAEKVDFVILAGNLVDPHAAGPRGLTFLHEQFARLAECGIAVYWATSPADRRGEWPASVVWPSNVHLFRNDRVEQFTHSRDGEAICQIMGLSDDGLTVDSDADHSSKPLLDEFAFGADRIFTIAVLPHPLDPIAIADLPVRYWALGGAANYSTPLNLSNPQRIAHQSGSPQGRQPSEVGPHGAALVQFDVESNVRLASLHCDVVRWHDVRVSLEAEADRSAIERILSEQIEALASAPADCALLVRLALSGNGLHLRDAHRTGLAGELAATLRAKYGRRMPAVWTTAIEIEPPPIPDDWLAQETLLGDFLRAAHSCEHLHAEPLCLQAYMSERQLAGPLGSFSNVADPGERRSILRQAAALGADLLFPDATAIKEPSR